MGEKRILFLTEKRSMGGGETSLLNLLSVRQSHSEFSLLVCPPGDLSMLAIKIEASYEACNFPNIHLRFGCIPTFSIRTAIRLWSLIRKYRIDIIQAESNLACYYGGLAAAFCGIPCIAIYHGFWKLNNKFAKVFFDRFIKIVLPVSQSVSRDLSAIFHQTERIRVIPLGVGEAFGKAVPNKHIAREILGLSPDRPIILQVARFESIKGHHYLIDAIEKIHNEIILPKPILIVVGGVMQPASKDVLNYKDFVLNKIAHSPMGSDIKYFGERRDVELFIRAADLLVVPSEYETFGMVIIEAMLLLTPIIATDVGGPRELIINGVSGILVPPCNPDALASAISSSLNNYTETMNLATKAYDWASEHYSSDVRYHKLNELYTDITN
jgi:glycosyltransferase involved in cell wall biosynthesis